jgi:hypothetical protein
MARSNTQVSGIGSFVDPTRSLINVFDSIDERNRQAILDQRYQDELAYRKGRDTRADELAAESLAYSKSRDTRADELALEKSKEEQRRWNLKNAREEELYDRKLAELNRDDEAKKALQGYVNSYKAPTSAEALARDKEVLLRANKKAVDEYENAAADYLKSKNIAFEPGKATSTLVSEVPSYVDRAKALYGEKAASNLTAPYENYRAFREDETLEIAKDLIGKNVESKDALETASLLANRLPSYEKENAKNAADAKAYNEAASKAYDQALNRHKAILSNTKPSSSSSKSSSSNSLPLSVQDVDKMLDGKFDKDSYYWVGDSWYSDAREAVMSAMDEPGFKKLSKSKQQYVLADAIGNARYGDAAEKFDKDKFIERFAKSQVEVKDDKSFDSKFNSRFGSKQQRDAYTESLENLKNLRRQALRLPIDARDANKNAFTRGVENAFSKRGSDARSVEGGSLSNDKVTLPKNTNRLPDVSKTGTGTNGSRSIISKEDQLAADMMDNSSLGMQFLPKQVVKDQNTAASSSDVQPDKLTLRNPSKPYNPRTNNYVGTPEKEVLKTLGERSVEMLDPIFETTKDYAEWSGENKPILDRLKSWIGSNQNSGGSRIAKPKTSLRPLSETDMYKAASKSILDASNEAKNYLDNAIQPEGKDSVYNYTLPRNSVDLNSVSDVNKIEDNILRLEAIAKNPYANKYMIYNGKRTPVEEVLKELTTRKNRINRLKLMSPML